MFHIEIEVLLYLFFSCMYIYIFKPPRVSHSTSRLMSHERMYCTVGYVFFQEKMNHVYEHNVNDTRLCLSVAKGSMVNVKQVIFCGYVCAHPIL